MEALCKRTSFVRGENKMARENDVSSQSNLHDTPKRLFLRQKGNEYLKSLFVKKLRENTAFQF